MNVFGEVGSRQVGMSDVRVMNLHLPFIVWAVEPV